MAAAENRNVPDIVVVGHVALRISGGQFRLIGSGAFSSLLASRLGLRTALLTSAGPDINLRDSLPGIDVVVAEPTQTTVMDDVPYGSRTVKHVRQAARAIPAEAVPDAWRGARLLLLAPLIGEVDPRTVDAFPLALVCAAAQGWLRHVDADGRIEDGNVAALNLGALHGRAGVLAISEADLGGRGIPAEWERAFPVIVLTRGRNGVRVLSDGRWWRLSAFPVGERDATGAGDVFATAFMVRYADGGNSGDASRFAAAAASLVVEKGGLEGIPYLRDVERRLSEHPELQLVPEEGCHDPQPE